MARPVSSRSAEEGIDSKLDIEGLEILKEMGHETVILLGHETGCPRFGFEPEARSPGWDGRGGYHPAIDQA